MQHTCDPKLAPGPGRGSKVKNPKSSFTLVEVMIVAAILVLLAAIFTVVASGVQQKQKTGRTQSQIVLLAQAVDAFKTAVGYYPLAVPEDAWNKWTDFADNMSWHTRWTQYFADDSGHPKSNWDSRNPTNIHMLDFQLEQVPAAAIFDRIKETYKVDSQKYFDNATDTWKKADKVCRISHPLDTLGDREVYQVQDAWGNPLRFWTGDILKWAKRTSGGWDSSVLDRLSARLQQANWGFFIESAGKDGKFGWWGATGEPLKVQAAEDNIYSAGQ
jgi:type II secretory pathway pseudopilin PulG